MMGRDIFLSIESELYRLTDVAAFRGRYGADGVVSSMLIVCYRQTKSLGPSVLEEARIG